MYKTSDILVTIMKMLGVVIFGFLALITFLFTQRHGKAMLGEYVCQAPLYEEVDNIFLNIMIAGLIVFLFCILKKQKEASLKKVEKYLLAIDLLP